jgi:hypothetical protein
VCHYYLPVSAIQSLSRLGAHDILEQVPAPPGDSAGGQCDEAERVVGLRDAVQGRVNLVSASGKVGFLGCFFSFFELGKSVVSAAFWLLQATLSTVTSNCLYVKLNVFT